MSCSRVEEVSFSSCSRAGSRCLGVATPCAARHDSRAGRGLQGEGGEGPAGRGGGEWVAACRPQQEGMELERQP